MTKIKGVIGDEILFDDGTRLISDHYQECCESHYLWFGDIKEDDYEGLEFDLSTDDFFERIEGYGIALKSLNGHPLRIPGYANNNGYYSSHLTLVIKLPSGDQREYDITECQDYKE